jgi:hypothetical protein
MADTPPNNDTQIDPPVDPFRVSEAGDTLKIDYSAPTVTGEKDGVSFDQNVEDYFSDQVANPTLPEGGEQAVDKLVYNENESIDPVTALADVATTPQTTATQAANAEGTATIVSDAGLAELLDISPANYQALEVEGIVGEVTPAQLLRTQLANLVGDVESGNAPWADVAIRTANDLMLKRGIGASSLAGAAISQAVLEAAIPIAQFDAEQFGQINIENIRNRQQALLSNQAAVNVARNFNAKSIGETDQFIAGLRDRVLRENADRLNAMEQFNKAETNKSAQFNTSQDNAIKQFRDKQEVENNQFLATNQVAIQKNNAEWRRSINTANTAAANAANQLNAQNRFNLSTQAQANLWQRANDIFDHANTVAENARDRAFQVVLFSLSRDAQLEDLESAARADTLAALGTLATDFITSGTGQSLINSLGDVVSNIFSDDLGGDDDIFTLGSGFDFDIPRFNE